MKKLVIPCVALTGLCLAVACGGSSNDSSSDGGSSAGGNASTSGGSAAKGGSTQMVTGAPFQFPQNKKPGACNLTTAANASNAVKSAYDSWKQRFVVSAGSGMRVQRPDQQNDTVSEGIGYGMILAVYMGDRPVFDGLWTYAKAHFDAKGLMNWRINSDGNVNAMGTGSATDADEDMAWALIGAARQWQSASYLSDAQDMLSAMANNELAPDGMLKPGDAWGSSPNTFPDYFSPAYFRVFAAVSKDSNWSGVVLNRNYEILDKVSGMYGLVPDTTTGTYDNMGKTYKYDACRTPWRIAMDYCFNGEPRAKAYLDKIGPFFDKIGAANIGDGYALTGEQTSGNHNMAFIGPAGVAGMAGYQKLLDDAFAFGANGGNDQSYYTQSLRVITMLMMSGNFIDLK